VNVAAGACAHVNLPINNAGIMLASLMLAEGFEAALRAEMEVNVFGMLRIVRAFAPVLANNAGGAHREHALRREQVCPSIQRHLLRL
jgi:NAD(P)-dependent dehydrogenase (short-subunit alcohol dehydrogenase family)